jgi:hypothetical protein
MSTVLHHNFKDLRNVWTGMLNESIVGACKAEENEHDMKMSMLLKTAFYIHKSKIHCVPIKRMLLAGF